jgi:hypothetical protein
LEEHAFSSGSLPPVLVSPVYSLSIVSLFFIIF